jgi:hypothetical protein
MCEVVTEARERIKERAVSQRHDAGGNSECNAELADACFCPGDRRSRHQGSLRRCRPRSRRVRGCRAESIALAQDLLKLLVAELLGHQVSRSPYSSSFSLRHVGVSACCRDDVVVVDEFADPRPRHPAEVKKQHPAVSQVVRRERWDTRSRARTSDRRPEAVGAEALEYRPFRHPVLARHERCHGLEQLPWWLNPPGRPEEPARLQPAVQGPPVRAVASGAGTGEAAAEGLATAGAAARSSVAGVTR